MLALQLHWVMLALELLFGYQHLIKHLSAALVATLLLTHMPFDAHADYRRSTQCAGADTLLGPEMRSTGEVMGIDRDFSSAYAKVGFLEIRVPSAARNIDGFSCAGLASPALRHSSLPFSLGRHAGVACTRQWWSL